MCKGNISYFLKELFSVRVHPILPNVHVQFPSNEASANSAHLCILSIPPAHTGLPSESLLRQQILNGSDISQLGAAKSCSICFLIKTW